MNRPRNTYTPGQPLPVELHAIGRPVTLFLTANEIKAGTVVLVVAGPSDGTLLYDIQTVDGGRFIHQRLGTLMNPQPNTFVYAP